jgi:homocysteine S-methyltransferase
MVAPEMMTFPLVLDGGMGTELYERGFYINRPFEELNLQSPRDVVAVHEAYIESGADVLTLNTFSANTPQFRKYDIQDQLEPLLTAAIRCGNQARKNSGKSSVRLGLSMGPLGVLVEPLGPVGLDEAKRDFAAVARVAKTFADLHPADGTYDLYILETFTNLSELEAAIDGIRSVDPARPILASISVKSAQTEVLAQFASRIGGRADVQYLGLNCSEGPSDLLTSLQKFRPLTEKPVIIQPNAGTPRHVNGRYFYMTSPDYLAKYAKRFIENGAQGVGGCCGTGPDHVRAIRNAVRMAAAQQKADQRKPGPLVSIEVSAEGESNGKRKEFAHRLRSVVLEKIAEGKKVLSIEMIPPRGTDVEKFLASAKLLADLGVDFVNIPDGARAMTRVGSLHMASWIQSATSNRLWAIPHFTTRDRNLIALQSDLLGACLNGVRDILMVTGDPPKLGNTRDATAVYDIDSIGLTYLAACLNRGESPNGDALGSSTGFGIGVASNPTAMNLELEWKRWNYKVESGAHFAITQPIFDADKFRRWVDKIGANHRPHIVGIWPLVSLRNAEFMANEVPGVHIPAWVLAEMEKAGDNRAEAEKRGVAIAQKTMEALSSECEGFCVSAPLGRVNVALDAIRGVSGYALNSMPGVGTSVGKGLA